MPLDPGAAGQGLEQRLVEAAGRAIIDILRRRLHAQAGEAQPCLQTFAVALELFALDHQRQSRLEVQSAVVPLSAHLFQGTGHADKAEFTQPISGGVVKQGGPPQS